MKNSYQLIEPEFLNKLDNRFSVFDFAIINFIVDVLRKEETIISLPIKVDVVIANYNGKYPTIGIHYEDESIGNVEDVILNLIKKCMTDYPLGNFYEYLLLNQDRLHEEFKGLGSVPNVT